MQHSPFGTSMIRGRSIRIDAIFALALAAILTLAWMSTDWMRLSRLLLPDHDDMMRLAQVRDWLAGQGVNDWTQYRMAPPRGAPMHWSRVNDVGIAAIILAATPVVGRHYAELTAILLYPAILFACAIFLAARIGRRLWGAEGGPIAAVLMALAYPGTTVFIPGRIDHHALQAVLIQLQVLILMRAPTVAGGIAGGVITGISLVVGLEIAPQVAALISVLAVLWVVRGMAERRRLAGFAIGLAATTLAFLAFLRPTYWTASLCDAFTPASSTGTLAVGGALAMLAAATPVLTTWRIRIVTGAMLGAAALGGTLLAFPSCIDGPYGAMDPFLLKAFLPYIDEANGLIRQPRIARVLAIGGMLAAASIVSVWMMIRERRRWAAILPLAAVVVTSGLITLFQVRGTYIGAPLGASMLAGLIVMARRRSTWRLPAVIGAWLASAGMAYNAIPEQIELRLSSDPAAVKQPRLPVVCSEGDAWRQVDQFPPGAMMAGTNVAAYVIGATHHSTIGAGYHRNNAGNIAMYRFFLSTDDHSRRIAHEWKVAYVAFCPGDFSEIDVTRAFPNSLATSLEHGRTPEWLEPLPLHGTPLRLYRVR